MPKRFVGSQPRPEQRRFRISVPEADASVLDWMGAQSDLSASLRTLIRDAIRRDGYRDATCYPVEQQPRRGRPPRYHDEHEHEYENVTALEENTAPELGINLSDEVDNDDIDNAVSSVPVMADDEETPSVSAVADVLGSLR